MHTAAGSYAGRKAASVNSSGQDEGKQQGFVYAVLVPGGRGEKARGLGAGSEGVPSQGVGGGSEQRGEGTCKQHLRGVCQPHGGSSS